MLEWPDVSLNGWRAKLQNWCLVDRCHCGVPCSQTSPLPPLLQHLVWGCRAQVHQILKSIWTGRMAELGWQNQELKRSLKVWMMQWCLRWRWNSVRGYFTSSIWAKKFKCINIYKVWWQNLWKNFKIFSKFKTCVPLPQSNFKILPLPKRNLICSHSLLPPWDPGNH